MKHLTCVVFALVAAAAMTSCGGPQGLAAHGLHMSTFNVPYRNPDGGPYRTETTTGHQRPATLRVGETAGVYYHNGRYYSGGRYETGRFHDHGSYYPDRYYHEGRYYYGGDYRQHERTSNVRNVKYTR